MEKKTILSISPVLSIGIGYFKVIINDCDKDKEHIVRMIHLPFVVFTIYKRS